MNRILKNIIISFSTCVVEYSVYPFSFTVSLNRSLNIKDRNWVNFCFLFHPRVTVFQYVYICCTPVKRVASLQQWLWNLLSSEIWRRRVWEKTNVLEERTALITKINDGGLQMIGGWLGVHLPWWWKQQVYLKRRYTSTKYTAWRPSRQ
jgi:hypothetical protein